ncbi:MAG: hypothetical protein Q9214_002034 [Letrouitia sp. 1 TL-2023]
MATAAVEVPSHNRVEPGSQQLKAAAYPDSGSSSPADPNAIAADWVDSFNRVLSNREFASVKNLFLAESCWRDQLGLSWNYHTLKGPDKIESFLASASDGPRIHSINIDNTNATRQPTISAVDFNGKINGVVSFLTVETDIGRGRGLVRLLRDLKDSAKWKAFTLFTAMYELKGHEETVKANRPHGVVHGGQPGRKNWLERRTAQENFEGDLEPTVLILGAGQGGLTSAARLERLQVPTLVIDSNARIGDNWRKR